MTTDAIVRWCLDSFEGRIYTDDPVDSGGATKHGITLRTWQYYVAHVLGETRTVTKAEIQALTIDQAVNCILALHVGEGRLDEVKSWRLRLVLVDWAIHSWHVAPVKALQSAVHGLAMDGVIGPHTRAALALEDPLRLAGAVSAARMLWLDDLIRRRPKDARYRSGWMRRVALVLRHATRSQYDSMREDT